MCVKQLREFNFVVFISKLEFILEIKTKHSQKKLLDGQITFSGYYKRKKLLLNIKLNS